MNRRHATTQKAVAKRPTTAPSAAESQGLSRKSASPAGFALADVLGLQRSIGNQAVGLLLRQTANPSFAGAQASGSVVGSASTPSERLVDDAREFLVAHNGEDDANFNLTEITNELERAIDQAEVAPGLQSDPTERSTWVRKIDAKKVIAVLADRTPTQMRSIQQMYLLRCKEPLGVDLFGVNKSGHGSSLDTNQQLRIRALLQGSKAETVSDPKAQGEETMRALRVQGDIDATEIKELLSKGLDSEVNRERVMTLTRRAGPQIDAMDNSYNQITGRLLTIDVDAKLNGLQLARHAALRAGDRIKADACAIEAKRRQIPTGDDIEDFLGRDKLTKPNLAAIEGIIALTRQEAKAEALATGVDPNALVQKRMTELLGKSYGREDGSTIGQSLTTTFGKTAGDMLSANMDKSLVEVHAYELLRMEKEETTSSAKIATILKSIRTEAQADLMRGMSDPWLGQAEKKNITNNFDRELTLLAKKYQAQFVESYDSLRGDARSFSVIVSSADLDSGNWMMLYDLRRGGGKLSDYDAMEYAIGQKNVEDIKAIMARLPRKELNEIEQQYNKIHGPATSFRAVLFGKNDEMQPGNNVAQAEAQQNLIVVDGKIAERGGLLSGRNATAANEALQKPEVMEGVDEVNWLAAFGSREANVTKMNSGAMGTMRDWGDVPESKQIFLRTNGDLAAMAGLWHEEKLKLIAEPTNDADVAINKRTQVRQRAILLTMRKVRAALSGDVAAYEEENKAMVETLKSAISMAVQLALAAVLPGVSNILGDIALSIATSVATNVLIQGDAYSLTDLRNDILGGAAGGLGSKLGKVLGEGAGKMAGELAERILPSVASATGKASRLVGISTKLGGEAMSFAGGNVSTSIANGQSLTSGFTSEGILQSVVTYGIGKIREAKAHQTSNPAGGLPGTPASPAETLVGQPGMDDVRGPDGSGFSGSETLNGHPVSPYPREPGVNSMGPTEAMPFVVDPLNATEKVPGDVDPFGVSQEMPVVEGTYSGPKRNAQQMEIPNVPGVTTPDRRAKQFAVPEIPLEMLQAEVTRTHADYEVAKKAGSPSEIAAAKATFEESYGSLLAAQGKGGKIPESMQKPAPAEISGPRSPRQIVDSAAANLQTYQQAVADGWDSAPELLNRWQAAYAEKLSLSGVDANATAKTISPIVSVNKPSSAPPSSRPAAPGSAEMPASGLRPTAPGSAEIPASGLRPTAPGSAEMAAPAPGIPGPVFAEASNVNSPAYDASKTIPGMGAAGPGSAAVAITEQVAIPDRVTEQVAIPDRVTEQIAIPDRVTEQIAIPDRVTEQIPIPMAPASDAHLSVEQREAAMTARNQERNAHLLEGFDDSQVTAEGPLHSIEDRALKDITTDEYGNVTHHLRDVRSVQTHEFGPDGKLMDATVQAGPAPATMIAQPGFKAFGRDDYRPVRDNGVVAAHQAEVVSGPAGSHIRTPLEMSGTNPVVWGERGTALGPDGQWQSSQTGGVDDVRIPQTFDPNAPANFQPRSPEQMMAWESSNGPLPADQRYALWNYSDDGSHDMNNQLRGNEERIAANSIVNDIQHRDIDAAMRPLPMDVETSRRVGINAFDSLGVTTPEQLKGMIGSDYTDPGNISTSIAGKWSGQVQMVIEAPTGTRARYLSGNIDPSLSGPELKQQVESQTLHPLGEKSGPIAAGLDEFELLLERGTTFRIVDVVEPSAPGESWVVRMRVISQGASPSPGS
jgi:hypothetical protein